MAVREVWMVAVCSVLMAVTISQDMKPGQCPPSGLLTNDTCENQCTTDNDCPGEKICCYNGCGVTDCMSPRDGIPTSIDNRLEILACEGSFVDFVCPSGYHVKILSAFWGRGNGYTCRQGAADMLSSICSLWNTTSVLRAMCENKPNCKIPAMSTYFGEPCNQPTYKYLKAEYYCQENINNVVVCENTGLKSISCSNGQVIGTHSAFWGRSNNPNICPDESLTGVETCSQDNANQIFREMCNGRMRCEFDPVTSVFGEICLDVPKFLSLNYSCVDCVNQYPDDNQCEMWALQGECGANPEWMSANCMKTCERCSDWKPEIVNYHSNSTECDIWARRGECISNAPFMLVYCRQSCVASKQPTDCSVNKHDDIINLRDCQRWANNSECQRNNHYMFWDCTKACFGCHEDNYIRCTDKHPNEMECQIRAANGECTTDPGWMIPNCFKTCLECVEDPVCRNIENDTACDYWESVGECEKNPVWMHQNCWKSCIKCKTNENELTDCSINEWDKFRDSDNCESRYLEGQCVSNTTDMFINCTKACFECDDENNEIRCVNKYNNDDCEGWAASGECDKNPGWMIPNCFKSCMRCTEDPVCKNKADYWDCEYWQSIGECTKNPVWMYENCWMSCMKCEGDRLCLNKASNYDCEYWMRFGGCKDNPYYMLNDCSGACTRCDPNINGVPECRDLFPERDCTYWASNNRCAENPVWMLHYCRKSCTHCGQVPTWGASNVTTPSSSMPEEINSSTPPSTTISTSTTTPQATSSHSTTSTTLSTLTTTSTTTTPTTIPSSTTTTTKRPTTTTTTTKRPTTTTTTTKRPTTTTTTTKRPTTTTTTPTTTTTTRPPTTTTTTRRPTTTTTPTTSTTLTTTTTTTREQRTSPRDEGMSGQPVKFGADVRQVGVWRSETNAFTRGKSFVLPQKIPVSGRLTHFEARLVSDTEVYLEIWRSHDTMQFSTFKNFYRVYRLGIQYPGSSDKPVIVTEPIPDCFEVMEGDLLGFTTPHGVSPLDFRRDSTIKERTYFRSAKNERARFLSMFYTFQFAIGVLVEQDGMC